MNDLDIIYSMKEMEEYKKKISEKVAEVMKHHNIPLIPIPDIKLVFASDVVMGREYLHQIIHEDRILWEGVL